MTCAVSTYVSIDNTGLSKNTLTQKLSSPKDSLRPII